MGCQHPFRPPGLSFSPRPRTTGLFSAATWLLLARVSAIDSRPSTCRLGLLSISLRPLALRALLIFTQPHSTRPLHVYLRPPPFGVFASTAGLFQGLYPLTSRPVAPGLPVPTARHRRSPPRRPSVAAQPRTPGPTAPRDGPRGTGLLVVRQGCGALRRCATGTWLDELRAEREAIRGLEEMKNKRQALLDIISLYVYIIYIVYIIRVSLYIIMISSLLLYIVGMHLASFLLSFSTQDV